jgi:hypothetical protein
VFRGGGYRILPQGVGNPRSTAGRTRVVHSGGSVELRFGPQRPDDAEPSNWIQTVPGRAWFAYLRLYAPTQPYFDRTWPLNDIQPA